MNYYKLEKRSADVLNEGGSDAADDLQLRLQLFLPQTAATLSCVLAPLIQYKKLFVAMDAALPSSSKTVILNHRWCNLGGCNKKSVLHLWATGLHLLPTEETKECYP